MGKLSPVVFLSLSRFFATGSNQLLASGGCPPERGESEWCRHQSPYAHPFSSNIRFPSLYDSFLPIFWLF